MLRTCVRACVCVCNAVVWPFSRESKRASLMVVRLSTLTHEHVLVRLCVTADVKACVHVKGGGGGVCGGVGGSPGGTVNQFRLN